METLHDLEQKFKEIHERFNRIESSIDMLIQVEIDKGANLQIKRDLNESISV